MYNRVWTGDYTNEGTGGNTTAKSVGLTTSSQGYQYGMHVRAACGTPVTNKVLLGGWSSNITYVRNVDSEVWAYKGSVRIRRPDGSGHPNTIFGQSVVHSSRDVNDRLNYNTDTPNKDYPGTAGCASGLTRKIRWQWSANHVGNDTGWRYGGTAGGYSPEYSWANGTDKVFPSGSDISDFTGPEDDLDNGDKYEVAYQTWCENAHTGRHGPINRTDNFGNLTVLEGTGKFHVYCDTRAAPVPWCYAWHAGYNPLDSSAHTGYTVSASDRGICKSVAVSDKYCFSPNYGPNSSPWGW